MTTLTIVESVEIEAPPERIFRALTEPGELCSWWRDASASASSSWEIEPKVGGRWRSRWRLKSGEEFVIGGEILAIDAPRLLMYSWRDERFPETGETTVRYDIERTPTGSKVTVTHTGFGRVTEGFLDYADGWRGVLHLLSSMPMGNA